MFIHIPNYRKMIAELRRVASEIRKYPSELSIDMYVGGTVFGVLPQNQKSACFGCLLAHIYKVEPYRYDDNVVGYDAGGNAFARALGFGNKDRLAEFFSENPDLWGNKFGDVMFGSTNFAFDDDPRASQSWDIPVVVIIDKLEAVADRLEVELANNASV